MDSEDLLKWVIISLCPFLALGGAEQNNDKAYEFSYNIFVPETGNFHGHKQRQDEDGRMTGTYYLMSSDGTWRETSYSDTGSGFQSLTKKRPTDSIPEMVKDVDSGLSVYFSMDNKGNKKKTSEKKFDSPNAINIGAGTETTSVNSPAPEEFFNKIKRTVTTQPSKEKPAYDLIYVSLPPDPTTTSLTSSSPPPSVTPSTSDVSPTPLPPPSPAPPVSPSLSFISSSLFNNKQFPVIDFGPFSKNIGNADIGELVQSLELQKEDAPGGPSNDESGITKPKEAENQTNRLQPRGIGGVLVAEDGPESIPKASKLISTPNTPKEIVPDLSKTFDKEMKEFRDSFSSREFPRIKNASLLVTVKHNDQDTVSLSPESKKTKLNSEFLKEEVPKVKEKQEKRVKEEKKQQQKQAKEENQDKEIKEKKQRKPMEEGKRVVKEVKVVERIKNTNSQVKEVPKQTRELENEQKEETKQMKKVEIQPKAANKPEQNSNRLEIKLLEDDISSFLSQQKFDFFKPVQNLKENTDHVATKQKKFDSLRPVQHFRQNSDQVVSKQKLLGSLRPVQHRKENTDQIVLKQNNANTLTVEDFLSSLKNNGLLGRENSQPEQTKSKVKITGTNNLFQLPFFNQPQQFNTPNLVQNQPSISFLPPAAIQKLRKKDETLQSVKFIDLGGPLPSALPFAKPHLPEIRSDRIILPRNHHLVDVLRKLAEKKPSLVSKEPFVKPVPSLDSALPKNVVQHFVNDLSVPNILTQDPATIANIPNHIVTPFFGSQNIIPTNNVGLPNSFNGGKNVTIGEPLLFRGKSVDRILAKLKEQRQKQKSHRAARLINKPLRLPNTSPALLRPSFPLKNNNNNNGLKIVRGKLNAVRLLEPMPLSRYQTLTHPENTNSVARVLVNGFPLNRIPDNTFSESILTPVRQLKQRIRNMQTRVHRAPPLGKFRLPRVNRLPLIPQQKNKKIRIYMVRKINNNNKSKPSSASTEKGSTKPTTDQAASVETSDNLTSSNTLSEGTIKLVRTSPSIPPDHKSIEGITRFYLAKPPV